MSKRKANQQHSLQAFLAGKAKFNAVIAELQQMSADHFGTDPGAVLWAQAASLERQNRQLRQVADCCFRRGEFAD
jgi:hypothetical protein